MDRSDESRKALLRRYAIVLAVLAAYYLIVKFIGFSLDCPFRKITGLRCPGCGISSMFLALSEGDFSKAFHCNQVLFFMVPLFVLAAIIKVIFMPRFLSPKSLFYRTTAIVTLVILIGFGILRNIYDFRQMR